jgi:LysM repeat protein
MAAPALAVTGVLATAPHALAATPQAHGAPSATRTITAHLDAAVQLAHHSPLTYTVRTGDTLAGIAQHFYGRDSAWHRLYRDNSSKISNPDLIYPGQVLVIPGHVIAASGLTPVWQKSASQGSPSWAGGQASSSWAGSQASSSSAGGQASSSWAGSQGSSSSAGGQASQTSAGGQASQTSTQSGSASGSGSANLQSAVKNDIGDGNYLMAVAQYLVENGYSDAAAAGVASCVEGESSGNPEAVGSGGGGLIGWTPIGSAAPNSNIITGNAAQDMTTQLADLLYYNSTEIGQSLVTQLNSISDPVEAADFYSQNFEKPAVTDSDVVPSVAEQIYSELSG